MFCIDIVQLMTHRTNAYIAAAYLIIMLLSLLVYYKSQKV